MRRFRVLRGIIWLFIVIMVAEHQSAIPKLSAQTPPTILSIAIPSLLKDSFTQNLVQDFESSHENIKINIITTDMSFPSPTADIQKHFDALQEYTSSADVLFVNNNILSVEATRAGYFLDLAPLASEDKSVQPDDFIPAIWKSYQWDKGIWALPIAATPYVLTYQPSTFDKLGIAYPDGKWTLDDLVEAVNKVAVKDQDGKITTKGLDVPNDYSAMVLFRSIVGDNLYDSSQIPFAPQIDKPVAQTLLDSWIKLDQDNLLGDSVNRSPMGITPLTALLVQDASKPEQKRSAVLLPGDKAGLEVQAFAVSKGSLYPEQAYALSAYLTTRSEMSTLFSITPARKSLSGTDGNGVGLKIKVPEDLQPIAQQALDNAMPVSDVLFANYLVSVARNAKQNNVDASTSIASAMQTAQSNLSAAASRKDTLAIVVATPVPQNQDVGKITLKFGIQSTTRPLPNLDAWKRLIADFTAKDSQVGAITFELPLPIVTFDHYAERYDCFYLNNNFVPEINIGNLLNLNPYTDADPSFDKDDIVGNFIDQLNRDNKLWALPASLAPAILQYDATQFNKAGLPSPDYGWTIDAFKDAVQTLKTDPSQPPPFVSAGRGGTHLMLLVAAYGGLPIDYRTNPPTINYVDPATETAIQQVLDLAKKGYIKYTPIGTLVQVAGTPSNAALVNTVLNAYTLRADSEKTVTQNYKPVTYPKGSQYTALSYTLGTLYISKNAQNAEACYRWISEITHHPELFSTMPVQKSLINDPTLATTQGSDTVALYNQIAALMADPNTVLIPSLEGAQRSFFHQFWLSQAFDAYVLNGADLDTALKEAADKSTALIECVAKIPPLDNTNPGQAKEYTKAYGQCVTKIDPSFQLIFSLLQ